MLEFFKGVEVPFNLSHHKFSRDTSNRDKDIAINYMISKPHINFKEKIKVLRMLLLNTVNKAITMLNEFLFRQRKIHDTPKSMYSTCQIISLNNKQFIKILIPRLLG